MNEFKRLSSDVIPQADRPELVLRALGFIAAHGRRPTPAEIDIGNDERNVHYCCQAAAQLKLLDASDRVTDIGMLILTLDPDLQLLRFVCAFEESDAGKAWLQWADAKEFDELDSSTALDFLRTCADFSDSTIERRATTLRSWANKFHELRSIRKGTTLSFRDWSPMQPRDPDALSRVTALGSGESATIVHRLGPGTHRVRVVSGFFTMSGYQLLSEGLTGAEVYLLIGDDEKNPFARRSVSDAATVRRLFRESLERGAPSTARRQEIKKFHADLLRGLARLRHFEPRKHQKLHAKVYIFDRYAAYVTSANLTVNGLKQNIESGALMGSPHVEDYVNRFDAIFDRATPITLPILEEIEKCWAFTKPIPPYLLFLKVMYELCERDVELEKPSRFVLADFQQRLVRPVIRKILNYRGAMLISPTGTGKTVMAAHVAAYLAQEQYIYRIIVVCPNQSIGAKWKEVMRAYGRSVEVVTHGLLRCDEPTPENQRLLKDLEEHPRNTDLYIVDECHHFRNDETVGHGNLSRLLRPKNDDTRPYCLLLTATPISTGLTNLNMLLSLIRQSSIESVGQIDEVPAVVNVTLPFIIAHYGVCEKGRRNVALRFGDELLYFPLIRIQTARYASPVSKVFEIIRDLPLKFEDGERAAVQTVFGGVEWVDAVPSREYTLLRALLARRAESSPHALRRTVERMLQSIEHGVLRPVFVNELCEGLTRLMEKSAGSSHDTKLQMLFDRMRAAKPRIKVLIFSESVDTVHYLADELTRKFRERTIAKLDGSTGHVERQSILERFSPTSRRTRKIDDVQPSIDVLVTSDTCAEGEDLEDAALLINYDLTWTPLRLVQRIGRIDRATIEPREVAVFNFYPEADEYEEIVGLWSRLQGRSNELSMLTRAQVVGEHERRLENVSPDDLGPVRALYDNEDYGQFLNELLPTPRYMELWLAAREQERDRAKQLPTGVQAGEKRGYDGCYVLLRHEETIYSFFWDKKRHYLQRAPHDVPHEFLVKEHVCSERASPGVIPPERFDDDVKTAIQQWSATTGIDVEDVTVVAAKYITSG